MSTNTIRREETRTPKPERKGETKEPHPADPHSPDDSGHWVERPDWHGAGVVSENHTD